MTNVVLCVIDDIGPDQFYGYYPDLCIQQSTANMDARMASGVQFTKYTAQPTCSPARASFMTGLQPRGHGLGRAIVRFSEAQYNGLDSSFQTLPKVLSSNGYRTTGVGKWHMAGVDQQDNYYAHPLACGFDTWEGHLFQADTRVFQGVATNYSRYEWVNANTESYEVLTTYATTHTADRAIALLAGSEPFFLYACFNAPHSPYHSPPTDLHSFGDVSAGTDADKYEAMKEALDREIERFFDAIDLDETVVIVTGDNGTPSNEDAGPPIIRGFPASHRKATTYLGGVRAPLFAFGAGVGQGVSSSLVQAEDIPATVLELVGLNPKTAFPEAVSSISFADQLEFPSTRSRRGYSYAEQFTPNGLPVAPDAGTHIRSAENDRYHLVRLADDSEEMFDVQEDEFELAALDLEDLTDAQYRAYLDLKWVCDTNGQIGRQQATKRHRVRVKKRS